MTRFSQPEPADRQTKNSQLVWSSRISQTAVRRPLYYITREFRSPTIMSELWLNVLDGSRAPARTPDA